MLNELVVLTVARLLPPVPIIAMSQGQPIDFFDKIHQPYHDVTNVCTVLKVVYCILYRLGFH